MLSQDAVLRAADRAGLTPASIVLRRLDRSDWPAVAIDPDRYLYPASMIKVPLALATLTLVQEGVLTLTGMYEVTQSNMTANDKASPLVPGYTASLEQLIELAITISDNVATNMLFDIAGRERATQIVQQRYGLAHTAFYRKLSGSDPLITDPGWDGVHRNTHTAGDAAKLFAEIARDRVPFALHLRDVLGRQELNDKLSPGLYPGDRFAHKTGGTDEVSHDGGILDTVEGASYVLVVYTGLPATEADNARFGPFMSELRNRL